MSLVPRSGQISMRIAQDLGKEIEVGTYPLQIGRCCFSPQGTSTSAMAREKWKWLPSQLSRNDDQDRDHYDERNTTHRWVVGLYSSIQQSRGFGL